MLEKARDYVGDDVFSPYDFEEVGDTGIPRTKPVDSLLERIPVGDA